MHSTTSFAVEFAAPYHIAVREKTTRKPKRNEALVRSICSGISAGTEMLAYRGELPDDILLDTTIGGLNESVKYPLEYGYSIVGQVEDVHDRTHSHMIGKNVFSFHPHESQFLQGINDLVLLPTHISPECGVFLPNMETALGFIMDGAPMMGEKVLVMGLGVVGHLLAALLQKYPLNRLTLVDPVLKRRSLVRKNNFTEVLSQIEAPSNEDDYYDLVYETSGHPVALNQAISCTGYKGRVIVGSWYGKKNVSIDLGSYFHRSKMTIYASQVSNIDPVYSGRWDKKRRINLALDKLSAEEPTYLISHQYNIHHAAMAYRKLDIGKDAVQVILTY